MTAVSREEIRGGVRTATATSAIAAGATSLNVGVGELSTWTFSTGNRFPVVINAGRADEEHVYATAVSGDSLTGLVRGQDGTLDQPHASGFTVQHGLFAKHIDLLNEFLSLPAAKGDLVVAGALDEWIALTVGANGAVLKANSGVAGGVEWATTLGGLTLTTATLTAPTIADFTNAAHDHGDANDGGNIPLASVSDYTAWDAYTPVWTGSLGNPIGGSVIGRYRQVGTTVEFVIRVTTNAVTSFGSGNYSFSLPVEASSDPAWLVAQIGAFRAVNPSPNDASFVGGLYRATQTTVQAYAVSEVPPGTFGGIGLVTSGSCIWAQGASFHMSGSYETELFIVA